MVAIWLLVIAASIAAEAQTDSVPGSAPGNPSTVQCIATKADGSQCLRRFKTPAYTDEHPMTCWSHDPNGAKCGAVTKAKGKCKRRVKARGVRCYQHKETPKKE